MSFFNILNSLHLREREGKSTSEYGGWFFYFDPLRKKKIEFRWDAAGVNDNGSITLIEEEEKYKKPIILTLKRGQIA